MESWKEFKTSDFGDVVTGSTPDTKIDAFWNGDYPFYSPADFTNDLFCNKTERTVSKTGLLTGRIIPKNSIMVACIASIGKMALNTESGITNQQINTIVVNEGSDFKYIYYLLLFNVNKIKSIAPQTTIPIINKTTFSNLFFYSTSNIVEQRKIAEILSTIDKSIEQTQELIGKYKNIKNGLMHDLLKYGIDNNGNIRNPQTHSFVEKNGMVVPEEWEVDALETIFTIISGSTPSTEIEQFWNGRINWITPNDLNKIQHIYINESERKITDAGLKSCSANLIPANAIVMSSRAPIGYVAISNNDFTTNQGCKSFVIKNKEKNLAEFHYFNLVHNVKRIKDLGTGTTFMEVSKKDLSFFIVSFPNSIDEQEKIAKTIIKQDNLIESEQTNLSKLQKQKQGLMQDLLTGKVRVKL